MVPSNSTVESTSDLPLRQEDQGTTDSSVLVHVQADLAEADSSIASLSTISRMLLAVKEMVRCTHCKCRLRRHSSAAMCDEDPVCGASPLDMRVDQFIGKAAVDFSENHGHGTCEVGSDSTTTGADSQLERLSQQRTAEWELGPDVPHTSQNQPLGELDNSDVWSVPSTTPSEWSHAHEHRFQLGLPCTSDPKMSQASHNSLLSSATTLSEWSASSCRNPPVPPKALIARGDSIFEEPDSELTLDSIIEDEWHGYSEISNEMPSSLEGQASAVTIPAIKSHSMIDPPLKSGLVRGRPCRTALPKPLPQVLSL